VDEEVFEQERLIDGGSRHDDFAGFGAGVEGGDSFPAGARDEGVAVEPLEGGDDLSQAVGPSPPGGPLLALLEVPPEAPGEAVGIPRLGQLRFEGLGLGLLGLLQPGQPVGEDGLEPLGSEGGRRPGSIERTCDAEGRGPQRSEIEGGA
jgi:hypothetical protein